MPPDPRTPIRTPTATPTHAIHPAYAVRPNGLPTWPWPNAAPIYPHRASGRWAFKGPPRDPSSPRDTRTTHYAGTWSDAPRDVLDRYHVLRPAVEAGHAAPTVHATLRPTLTLLELAECYLDHRQDLVDIGDIARESYQITRYALAWLLRDDHRVEGSTLSLSGHRIDRLTHHHFRALTLAMRGYSTSHRQQLVGTVRAMFAWARRRCPAIPEPQYGDLFNAPKASTRRSISRSRTERAFEPGEIRALLGVADPLLRAVIYLGINCGFGVADLARLRTDLARDLDIPRRARIDLHPRAKSNILRKCALWPETASAILAARAAGFGDDELLLTTARGKPLSYLPDPTPGHPSPRRVNGVRSRWEVARARANVKGRFYLLRVTCNDTLQNEQRDDVARRVIMGHRLPGMDETYARSYSMDRIRSASEHVRRWLFEVPRGAAKRGGWRGVVVRPKPTIAEAVIDHLTRHGPTPMLELIHAIAPMIDSNAKDQANSIRTTIRAMIRSKTLLEGPRPKTVRDDVHAWLRRHGPASKRQVIDALEHTVRSNAKDRRKHIGRTVELMVARGVLDSATPGSATLRVASPSPTPELLRVVPGAAGRIKPHGDVGPLRLNPAKGPHPRGRLF